MLKLNINGSPENNNISKNSDTHYKSFNNFINYFLIILNTFIIISGSYIYFTLDNFMDPLLEINKEFSFPKIIDLLFSLMILIVLLIVYYYVRKLTENLAELILDHKLKEDPNTLKLYKLKLCTNLFKMLCYISSSLIGYYTLKDFLFYPDLFKAKLNMSSIFIGYPKMFYFNSDDLLFYYCFNLSYVIFDFLVLFMSPIQPDFLTMLLHHNSTLNLIILSYKINLLHIGCVVYYIHFFGDAFVYLCRFLVNTRVHDYVKVMSAVLLLFVFIYTRFLIVGKIILDIYFGMNFVWKPVIWSLFLSLISLYILHIFWIIIISYKMVKYLISNNIEDVWRVKKE